LAKLGKRGSHKASQAAMSAVQFGSHQLCAFQLCSHQRQIQVVFIWHEKFTWSSKHVGGNPSARFRGDLPWSDFYHCRLDFLFFPPRKDSLATSLDCENRQTLFSSKCGFRISSPNPADTSRVVGKYGGNIEHISSRLFDITIHSPNQVNVNGQAKKSRFIYIQVRPDTVIQDTARQAAREL